MAQPEPTNPRVFVTGGSGFVGASVLKELLARGYAASALVQQRALSVNDPRVVPFKGDLFDPSALAKAMEGCDAVIHLVGIIKELPSRNVTFERIHVEGTRAVVDAARRAGMSRFIHMSALGSRPTAISRYHQSKFAAEEIVRTGGVAYTILRPSMIHGPEGDFMKMEVRWARGQSAPFLFMPYFAAGAFGTRGAGRLQPVYVNDVARAFVDALQRSQTINQTYVLGGQDAFSWPQMHRLISKAVVKRQRKTAGIPVWYANALTRIIPRGLLPFNKDQVIMSQENNTCDMTKFTTDFGWSPRGLEETLREYADEL